MGRLRNISASFKAAAFPTAATTTPPATQTAEQTESPDRGQAKKEAPTIIREASSNSVPESSSGVRPTSMIYTPPTIGAVNDEIEELRPVFRYVEQVKEHRVLLTNK